MTNQSARCFAMQLGKTAFLFDRVDLVGREAIETEAQVLCMLTQDFTRACEAVAAQPKPRFQGD